MSTTDRTVRVTVLLMAGLLAATFAACGPEVAPYCRVDADCASGICLSDGTCEPQVQGDGGTPDGGTPDGGLDGGAPADAGPDDGGVAPDGGVDGGDPPTCHPDLNGVIDRDEVIYRPGLTAHFRVAAVPATDDRGIPVDTAGEDVAGVRTWDLDKTFGGDHDKAVTLVEPASKWFGEDFPDATYVSPMNDETEEPSDVLWGVFKATPDALLLLGYASEEDGLYKTRLRHDPPVPMLRFPLQVGDEWTVEADLSGLYNGVVTSYDETWTTRVDAAGEVVTPYGTFEALRVRTVMEKKVYLMVWPWVMTDIYRTYLWESECFGTIASIKSLENEEAEEFTQAAEVMRITP